jgi:hypothetical protein
VSLVKGPRKPPGSPASNANAKGKGNGDDDDGYLPSLKDLVISTDLPGTPSSLAPSLRTPSEAQTRTAWSDDGLVSVDMDVSTPAPPPPYSGLQKHKH